VDVPDLPRSVGLATTPASPLARALLGSANTAHVVKVSKVTAVFCACRKQVLAKTLVPDDGDPVTVLECTHCDRARCTKCQTVLPTQAARCWRCGTPLLTGDSL
jgi:uncharacterized paraquat-inducible protein A